MSSGWAVFPQVFKLASAQACISGTSTASISEPGPHSYPYTIKGPQSQPTGTQPCRRNCRLAIAAPRAGDTDRLYVKRVHFGTNPTPTASHLHLEDARCTLLLESDLPYYMVDHLCAGLSPPRSFLFSGVQWSSLRYSMAELPFSIGVTVWTHFFWSPFFFVGPQTSTATLALRSQRRSTACYQHTKFIRRGDERVVYNITPATGGTTALHLGPSPERLYFLDV